ncbi:MAG: metal-sulfur cluster assembly factor [Thermodesulfobacteriota bacterium]
MAMKKIITIQPDSPSGADAEKPQVELKKFEKKEPGGAVELTEESVFEALKGVNDPELPVSIVDLGLIYDVQISGSDVGLKMTLTTPGCSMGAHISGQAEEALKAIGARNVIVQVVWDPPWNPDMMSPEAKSKLGVG